MCVLAALSSFPARSLNAPSSVVLILSASQAPGFHAPAVKGSGGKGTVPCLVFPDGKVLDDSYLITKWASEKIPPNDGEKG